MHIFQIFPKKMHFLIGPLLFLTPRQTSVMTTATPKSINTSKRIKGTVKIKSMVGVLNMVHKNTIEPPLQYKENWTLEWSPYQLRYGLRIFLLSFNPLSFYKCAPFVSALASTLLI